ncbi:MAG: restriction endonuclease subunit S [Chlorobiaceae bacterium]
MNWAPYPKYKESGVQWLGEVPEHWLVTKIKFYYDLQLGKMLQPEPYNESDVEVKYLKAQHVHWNKIKYDEPPIMWASTNDIQKYSVQKGDLLICEGGDVGRAALLDEIDSSFIIQNALHRVRAKRKTCVRFLLYLMQHIAGAKWFDILCNKATIAHLTSEKLGALELALPPLIDQTAIADFLDRETGRIDTLTAKNQKLIELLKEERSALISRTVTRGLPEDAAIEYGLESHTSFKKSGVQWLGDVPIRWEVKRSDGIFVSDRNQMMPDSFRNEDIFHYSIPAVQEYGTGIIEEGESIASAKQLITEKCILVSKLNPRKATICIAEPKALKTLCSTEFVVLKARKCDLNYLRYFVQSELFRQELDSKVQSVTRSHQRAAPEDVYKFWAAWPLFTEQTAIANFLDRETGRIDKLVEKVKALITSLQEYRTAIITAAVTGKIDVRESTA